jgi:Na+-transporting NADH:ubiquinone oxidoreductase subunit F
MDYSVILASVVVFLIITFLLVGMLLGAKAKLLPSGPVSLLINGGNKVDVSSGSNLVEHFGK